MREGRIPFHGYEIWYAIEGDGEEPGKLPLLCLHGGPGATWHHMEPHAALAEGRRVIFYDQLRCGNSAVTAPHDPAMWTTELYVEEVDVVPEALGLDRVHRRTSRRRSAGTRRRGPPTRRSTRRR